MREHHDTMTDVLIVGAGPVGSTLACDLHRRGISFRIIDRKAETEPHSKACNLWQRTQEVFSAIGVLDRLLAESAPLHTFSVHGYGKLVDHIAMDQQESACPTPVFLGQNQIERILWTFLGEQGVAVETKTTVTGLTEQDGHVDVAIEREGGAAEVIHARYVAACDGSKSALRDMVGLGFKPEQLSQDRLLRQVDAKLVRWSRTIRPGHASFFLHATGYLGVLPLPGGYHRFFLVTDTHQVPDINRNPTVEEMQDAIRIAIDDPAVTLADPQWLSRGFYPHGVAPGFRSKAGHVFLVGDAGHVTLPVYGQGMNTGMQDAFNLSWKLAATLHGEAPISILDSYAAERRAVRIALDEEQARVWVHIADPGTAQRTLVRHLGKTLMAFGLEGYFQKRTSQLGIAYPDSPLSLDQMGRGTVKAGGRGPDAAVVMAPGLTTTTLFAETYSGGWTLLAFDGGDAGVHAALDGIVQQVSSKRPALRALAVLSEPVPGRTTPALLDLDCFAHDAYGLSRPALILIRPDGYVAVRVPLNAASVVLDYCETWMTRQAATISVPRP